MEEKGWYMLGGPAFGQVSEPQREFRAPAGQVKLCKTILEEAEDSQTIQEKLSEEYFAIILALWEMKIPFWITYSKGEIIYKKILKDCINELNGLGLRLKLMGFPKSFPIHLISYPRDMFTILPKFKTILVNSDIRIGISQKDGYQVLSSPYGEGGRALVCEKTMLINRYLLLDDKVTPSKPNTDLFDKIGIKVGLLPSSVAGIFSLTEIRREFFLNDHPDRVACLIKGKDRKIHLVVDSNIFTIEKGQKDNWIPHGPKDSLEKIRVICEQLGIKLHYPNKITVPYSLNLVQFPDGRILMTSGDDSVEGVISDIVGREKITTTEVPIRFLPVHNFAGIRCLLNEAPITLLKSRALVL